MRMDGDIRTSWDAQARETHEVLAAMYDEALNSIRRMHAETITTLLTPAWPAPTYGADHRRERPGPHIEQ